MRTLLAVLIALVSLPAWADSYSGGPIGSATTIVPTGGTVSGYLADIAGYNLSTPSCGAAAGANNTTALNGCNASRTTSGGGVIRIPSNYAGTYTYSYPDPSVVQEFDGPNINRSMVGISGVATDSGKVFSGVLGTARPSGNNRSLVSDFVWSQGSGSNGAQYGDFAHTFYEVKENWNCSTARQAAGQCPTVALQGEMDALYLSVFQGGPDATASGTLKSAGTLFVGGATCISGVGFCANGELQTTIQNATSLNITDQIDVQYAPIDTRTGELSANGVVYNSLTGTQTSAILANGGTSSAWTNVLQNVYQTAVNFTIDDAGRIILGTSSSPTAETIITNTGSLSSRSETGNLSFMDGNGVLRGQIDQDGNGGFSSGITDTNTPVWTTATAYTEGQIVINAGNIYRLHAIGGTSSVAPTQTSGCVAGADSLNWCFIAARTDAQLLSFAGASVRVTAPFYIRTSDPDYADLLIFGAQGDPNNVIAAPVGSIALRSDGAPTRTLYINENGTNIGWNPVITASTTGSISAAGTTLAGATQLTSRWNTVTTTPSGSGVSLYGNGFKDEQIVLNRGTNQIKVYPPTVSAQIEANGAGVAITLAVGATGRYWCQSTTQCYIVN